MRPECEVGGEDVLRMRTNIDAGRDRLINIYKNGKR